MQNNKIGCIRTTWTRKVQLKNQSNTKKKNRRGFGKRYKTFSQHSICKLY